MAPKRYLIVSEVNQHYRNVSEGIPQALRKSCPEKLLFCKRKSETNRSWQRVFEAVDNHTDYAAQLPGAPRRIETETTRRREQNVDLGAVSR